MKFSNFFTLVSTMLFAFSASASLQVNKILEKYSKSSSVEVQIKKIDEKLTLGSKTVSQGILKHAGGKIYLILESDKKVEFFYKDKKITLVEYPDQDFDKDGNRKVTVLSKNKPAIIDGLLKLFSNTKTFLREFKVLSEKPDGDSLVVELKPPQKNLKSFSIILNKKDKLIDSIILIDDVDTKTTLELKSLKLSEKISPSTFEFKPMKSDEVIPE